MNDTARRLSDFEQLARGLGDAPDAETRLALAVQRAVELVPGCDHAGVTVNEAGEPHTRAASDAVVHRANELQYELGEGPCLDTMRQDLTVASGDLVGDARWPRWAPRIHQEVGVCSMVSVLIYTKKRAYGALSLYGDRADSFDAEGLATAGVLAGHLAVAMAAGSEIDHLGVALASRTVIGQAVGILMERLDIDADQAFDYLRRVSMGTNRKLSEVATELVATRTLPDAR